MRSNCSTKGRQITGEKHQKQVKTLRVFFVKRTWLVIDSPYANEENLNDFQDAAQE